MIPKILALPTNMFSHMKDLKLVPRLFSRSSGMRSLRRDALSSKYG